jgi:hypothetical protein
MILDAECRLERDPWGAAGAALQAMPRVAGA